MTITESSAIFSVVSSRHIGWLFMPVEGEPMQEVKLWGFYIIGWSIHPLTEIKAGTPFSEIRIHLTEAFRALIALDIDEVLPLRLCEAERRELMDDLDKLFKRAKESPEATMKLVGLSRIQRSLRTYSSHN
jgi:hypothetical protein